MANGDTIEMGGCNYELAVKVIATDVCGLTNYQWELRNITDRDDSFLQDSGDDILTGDEEEFNITAPGLLPGDYKLRVHLKDECNNENYCEYYFSIKAVKKPTPVCYSS